ncbi:uncharacterized protein DUF938 [Rhodovulum imhoffii]|uniref:Uncharacterized protein DUF938 n=1 Tax=Rhodovulum imhoffii TaxID=365340 RepID=A0A2T5BUK5_9RHOB|nr:DUF938 domain-containing protein [Rhodovulum imhoffii]MBK5934802.1 hypothetical protein [Rhodovulum imhoffii]PTN03204.1 uncharacterized protein DUF938 [Rhodovulum imhoffii]
MTRRLPLSYSEALDGTGRRTSDSTRRNREAIAETVAAHAPARGRALELASGTGEHAVHLAARLGLIWQPTDADPRALTSIDAWARQTGVPLRPAVALDATAPGWAETVPPQDLIFASNILHLVSAAEAETLITEAARALAPGGVLMIYGPFLRESGYVSENDSAFDAKLRMLDVEIGYKSVVQVMAWCACAGLVAQDPVPMPAANLTQIARKPGQNGGGGLSAI